jgi:hypothetical protein
MPEKFIVGLDWCSAIDDAWAIEVERRIKEVESGAVAMLSGSETLAKLRAEFAH